MVEAFQEFSKRLGTVSLLLPYRLGVVAFKAQHGQGILPVGWPKGGEDIAARCRRHDSNAAVFPLFGTPLRFNPQADGVLVGFSDGQSKDFCGKQSLLCRTVVVFKSRFEDVGRRTFEPDFANENAVIDAFHHGLLHGRSDDAFVHRESLPGIDDLVNAFLAGFGKRSVFGPSFRCPNSVKGKDGGQQRREHGQGKVVDERGVFL